LPTPYISYGLVCSHLENPQDFPKPVLIRKSLCRDTPQLIYTHVAIHCGTNSKTEIMEELKLHSFGQNDHLESLKEKYNSLKNKIRGNIKMTESEKKTELDKLKKTFEKEKKDSGKNLY